MTETIDDQALVLLTERVLFLGVDTLRVDQPSPEVGVKSVRLRSHHICDQDVKNAELLASAPFHGLAAAVQREQRADIVFVCVSLVVPALRLNDDSSLFWNGCGVFSVNRSMLKDLRHQSVCFGNQNDSLDVNSRSADVSDPPLGIRDPAVLEDACREGPEVGERDCGSDM